jgi:hypothetical protein
MAGRFVWAGALLASCCAACSFLIETDGLREPAAAAAAAPVADAAVIVDAGSPADAPTVDAGPRYRAAVLGDGPLAYWRMGGGTDSFIADETGRGNRLLLQGGGHTRDVPGAIAGDPDPGIGFDGVSSSAIAEDPRAFDFPDARPFSLEVWFKPIPLAGGAYYHNLVNSSTGAPPKRNGYVFFVVPVPEGGGGPSVRGDVEGPGGAGAGAGGPAVPGAFAHYVFVFDGSRAHLFVDGILLKSSDPAVGAQTVRTSPFSVGQRASGVFDELAVYDKALSGADVVRHRDVGRGR